jgi:two-component system NtrC family sensor kinase
MISGSFQKLRTKIILMTLLFSIVPLLCLGASIYLQYRQAYRENVIESLRARVQNRSSHLETFLNERIAQLITVARVLSIDGLKEEAFLNTVFQALQSHSKSFIDLGVIDQDGTHLAYVGPYAEQLKTANYSREQWFHEVISSGFYVSDVMLGFRKVPHIFLAVTRVEGNRTWILRATISSDIVEQIVHRAQLGKNGDAFVINRKNILQTTPRFSGKLLESPAAPDFSSEVLANVQELNYKGTATLFATSELTLPRWVLVAREDLQEDMLPLLHARRSEILIILAGILMIVAGTVLTSRSITNALERVEEEKARSEDLAVQSNKMAALGKMAAGVAHEINNPLQVMKELTGLMSDDLLALRTVIDDKELEKLRGDITKMERQLDRCGDITHKMLRFGRGMEPRQEFCDVNLVLAEAISFLADEAQHRDIRIQTDYGEDLPRITTDVPQLQQAFLNIIDNAIDAVGRSGAITVRSSLEKRDTGQVIVKISDTGCGIPKEMLPRIFDPFHTTKGPKEGIGLGLSVSYKIIEQLNGKIEVESVKGKGTTFTICLPVAEQTASY